MKHLFSKSLSAAPGRLHMAAHSHHLWPDASFAGQVEAWQDAARLADSKWDRIMGEVWPSAQSHVAEELGTDDPAGIVFATNTHDFILRLFAAAPRPDGAAVRVLTSDGEFHSLRRQLDRWSESGEVRVDSVAQRPFETFSDRFLAAAEEGRHDVIFVSQIMFNTGHSFDHLDGLCSLGRPDGPWVVIDGYHAFMAVPRPFGKARSNSAFYLGGGYKYAMAGEGCAFLHAPAGFGPRPPLTGWFAEFEDLTLPPGSVGYRKDAMRFMGATFDASGLYRFNAIRRMLASNDLTTASIARHVATLQDRLVEALADTPFATAELLNPPGDKPRARFLAFRSPHSKEWSAALKDRDCVTDVRGDVLRIGLGLYHDEDDIDRFAALARTLD